MDKQFTVGMIGMGSRSLEILRGIRQVEGMRVTAVADPCAASAQRAVREFAQAPDVYGDYRALLDRKDLQGVIVATPNDTHASIAGDVVRSQKALYLEKPVCISMESGEALLALAQAHNARAMAGMQLRYSDVYREMKAMCERGAIGDVKMLFFRALRGPFKPGVDGWRMKKARSGSALLEVSVHQLDLFNWFAGAPLGRVAAFGGRDAADSACELNDNMLMLPEYQNGVKANLQAALFAPQGSDGTGLCVVGAKGTMYESGREIVARMNNDSRDELRLTTEGYDNMDRNAMAAFMALALEGKQPLTTLGAGFNAAALAILAEKSIQEKREIILS